MLSQFSIIYFWTDTNLNLFCKDDHVLTMRVVGNHINKWTESQTGYKTVRQISFTDRVRASLFYKPTSNLNPNTKSKLSDSLTMCLKVSTRKNVHMNTLNACWIITACLNSYVSSVQYWGHFIRTPLWSNVFHFLCVSAGLPYFLQITSSQCFQISIIYSLRK